jgi:hypothetical protein
LKEVQVYFTDRSLLPENQPPLIITAAPYGPTWIPSNFPEDIPVTWDEQMQKAIDCYEAGARILHIHVRDPKTGKAHLMHVATPMVPSPGALKQPDMSDPNPRVCERICERSGTQRQRRCETPRDDLDARFFVTCSLRPTRRHETRTG